MPKLNSLFMAGAARFAKKLTNRGVDLADWPFINAKSDILTFDVLLGADYYHKLVNVCRPASWKYGMYLLHDVYGRSFLFGIIPGSTLEKSSTQINIVNIQHINCTPDELNLSSPDSAHINENLNINSNSFDLEQKHTVTDNNILNDDFSDKLGHTSCDTNFTYASIPQCHDLGFNLVLLVKAMIFILILGLTGLPFFGNSMFGMSELVGIHLPSPLKCQCIIDFVYMTLASVYLGIELIFLINYKFMNLLKQLYSFCILHCRDFLTFTLLLLMKLDYNICMSCTYSLDFL